MTKGLTLNKPRVKSIDNRPFTEEAITVDFNSNNVVRVLDNPDEVVPHNEIPEKLRKAIIAMSGEEYFYNTEWNRARLKRLSRALSHPKENVIHAIAQVCGPNCTSIDLCPYDAIGKAPVGDRCPVEYNLAMLLLEEYLKAISERLGTTTDELRNDMIVYNMIMGIVEADIVNYRLNGLIASTGLTQEDPTIIDSEVGTVYYKTEESVAMRIKERVNKRKDTLFEQLIATPEMEAKYRNRKTTDAFSKIFNALDKLDKLFDETKVIDGEIVEDE